MQDSRTPRLLEHFWVPILGASCSNKLFVGTVRPSHLRFFSPLWDMVGKMRGVPARWGDPARGIPTLLDTVWAEECHEPGPLPPLEPGPPLPAGTPPPPSAPLWEGKGQEVPAREGVPARGSLELWAVWPWEYHEPGPPNEPGPLAFPEWLGFAEVERICGYQNVSCDLSPLGRQWEKSLRSLGLGCTRQSPNADNYLRVFLEDRNLLKYQRAANGGSDPSW